MAEYFADWETLPNGICVRRKIKWYELESWPKGKPWLATVSVGGWHYSNRGDETKEKAISSLFEYMQEQVKNFKDHLERQQNKIKELTGYLETNDVTFHKL